MFEKRLQVKTICMIIVFPNERTRINLPVTHISGKFNLGSIRFMVILYTSKNYAIGTLPI